MPKQYPFMGKTFKCSKCGLLYVSKGGCPYCGEPRVETDENCEACIIDAIDIFKRFMQAFNIEITPPESKMHKAKVSINYSPAYYGANEYENVKKRRYKAAMELYELLQKGTSNE